MPRRAKKPLTTSGSERSNRFASPRSGTPDSEAPDDPTIYNIIPSYVHAYKPGDPDNVRKIFKIGMPGYKAAKDHTRSCSTRVPGRYDKHLDKTLRPAKAAYCPGLNLQIGEIADRSYQKHIEKFGPPPKCNSTNPGRVRHILNLYGSPEVKAENGITHHYAKVIPDIILPIVSELAFETSSWQTRYLQWTTEQQNDKAIADAVLRFDLNYPPPGSTHHHCPRASLDRRDNILLSEEPSGRDETPIHCPICDHPSRNDLRDVVRYFPCVMLYEFKNLRAGSYEHMIALLELACDDIVHWDECDSQTCEHDTERDFQVTGSRTGFDAANPIIQLEAADWTKPVVQLKNIHRTSARHIFQQIWSEMVKNDATFLVLSCGNIDMMVARNRTEKVLYLGDPIFTTEPGYIGMLVGLSIASIRDAIDRAARLRACENADNLPSSWTKYTEDDYVKMDEPDLELLDFSQMLTECRQLRLIPKKGSGLQKAPGNPYKRRTKKGSYPGLKIRIEPIEDDENVFIGRVKWKKRLLKGRVVVKTARGKHAVQKLARESCILRSLMGDPGNCKIPYMYGFFVGVTRKKKPHAVMLQQYVGNQLSKGLSESQEISVDNTLKHIGKRGYKYDIDDRSITARTSKNGEEEVYVVGLSRSNALKTDGSGDLTLFSALNRKVKRRRTSGLPVYLGPIPDNTIPPGQAFEQITTWVRELEGQVTLPETTRCIGRVDSLPDWLDIGVLPADADKLEELWDSRPDAQKDIVCMKMGGW